MVYVRKTTCVSIPGYIGTSSLQVSAEHGDIVCVCVTWASGSDTSSVQVGSLHTERGNNMHVCSTVSVLGTFSVQVEPSHAEHKGYVCLLTWVYWAWVHPVCG